MLISITFALEFGLEKTIFCNELQSGNFSVKFGERNGEFSILELVTVTRFVKCSSKEPRALIKSLANLTEWKKKMRNDDRTWLRWTNVISAICNSGKTQSSARLINYSNRKKKKEKGKKGKRKKGSQASNNDVPVSSISRLTSGLFFDRNEDDFKWVKLFLGARAPPSLVLSPLRLGKRVPLCLAKKGWKVNDKVIFRKSISVSRTFRFTLSIFSTGTCSLQNDFFPQQKHSLQWQINHEQ